MNNQSDDFLATRLIQPPVQDPLATYNQMDMTFSTYSYPHAWSSAAEAWHQIEQHLHQSAIYQSVRNQLGQSAQSSPEELNTLLGQIAQEALRIALGNPFHPATAADDGSNSSNSSNSSDDIKTTCLSEQLEMSGQFETSQRPEPPSDSAEAAATSSVNTGLNTGLNTASKPSSEAASTSTVTANLSSATASLQANFSRLKTVLTRSGQPQAEDVAALKQQEWQTAVQATMQHLKQVREQQGLSLEHLHRYTRITLHQLQALEQGDVDQLPEDIYVRGFIRRIGNALGLNGIALASAIPSLNQPENHNVVPSWSQSSEPARLQTPHLYLAYATLMAGAAGGLHLISQASEPQASSLPPLEPMTESVQPAEVEDLNPEALSAIQDVAPPEMMPY